MHRLIIAPLIALVFLTLAACGGEKTYDDFDHINHWDDLDQLTGDQSLVYFYTRTCHACTSIKTDVLDMLSQLMDDVEVYLVDATVVQGQPPIELRYVPTLIVFHDGVVSDHMIGPQPVLTYLGNELAARE